ncbi:chemotaxis protein CheW [uncultured Jannaschia sp.]|uniref:chemotaxis protein CheW n=1 Tax=uncultured Jannaschia sp. TaxID=293347 RepID=UPI00260C2E3B|nr:chemotaxis protein CheW [uncultured Jannaschia sp.]
MPPEAEALAAPAELYATVIVAGQDFCIDIKQVRENRRWSPTTTLPHSPHYMMGTMNLRGEVIPIIDLAALFGFPNIEPTDRHVIVIIEHEEKIIGLAVEAVRRILSVTPDQIRDAPGAKRDTSTSCIRGLITTESGVIRIISVSDVVTAMEEVL